MAKTNRVRLPNHGGVSGVAISGWGAVLFGLPFVASWLFIRIADPEPSAGVPQFIVDFAAWAFGLVGIYLVVLGLQSVRSNRRRARLLKEQPEKPWFGDHAWNRESCRDDTWQRVRRALFGMGMFVCLMAPLNWWAFWSRNGSLFVQCIAGFFDLVFLYPFGYTLLIVARAIRFGSNRVYFSGFPYFLGEQLKCTVRLNVDIRGLDSLELTLRSIEEVYETSGTGENRSTRVVCYEHWSEARRFETPVGHVPAGDKLTVTFDLPPSGVPTRLADRPAHFWELEVKGERPGVDLLAAFRLPVYSRDIAPPETASISDSAAELAR